MMDARDGNEARNRWATALRTATLIVVLGTLAAVWRPSNSDDAATLPGVATPPAAAAAPDMSVYLPARFPAPQGLDEPQAPTF